MTSPSDQQPASKQKLRTPDVMAEVQARVEKHYRSSLIAQIRLVGNVLKVERATLHLAREFGFYCGVERASTRGK